MCIAGPGFHKPAFMCYNLQHGSPELLRAHSGDVTLQIDALAQDLWSIGSLVLFTLTQRAWFAPKRLIAGDELAEAVKALHDAWVSSATSNACSRTVWWYVLCLSQQLHHMLCLLLAALAFHSVACWFAV